MPVTNFPNGIEVNNILTIDSNGIRLVDTVWDDLRVPVTSTKLGGTKDPNFAKIIDNGSGSQGLFAYLFDATTEEEVYFACQLPHGWKYETSIHPHVHWSPVANGSAGQKVCWGLEYSIQSINGLFGNSTIIYGDSISGNADPLIADTHYLTPLPEISTTGIDSVSAMILCRLFRDATGSGGTDSYAADVALLEFDFHYELDRIGSSNEYS